MTGNKVATKRMGNFDMASAADRILAFWEKYPSGKISTEQSKEEDGMLQFKAFIWKNKKDYVDLAKVPGILKDVLLSSADAEGTAKQGNSKAEKKDFEKLETIAVGRALALLGFSKDGTIASTEEMEEFHNYKEEKDLRKFDEDVANAKDALKKSEDMESLKKVWGSIARDIQVVPDVEKAKNDRKDELEKAKK